MRGNRNLSNRRIWPQLPGAFATLKIIFLAPLLLLPGCSDGDSDLPPASNQPASRELVRSIDGPPATLDPQQVVEANAAEVIRDMFEGLISTDALGRHVPGAAQSYAVSNDGLVYKFTLRKNLKWSNGDPLTAADFVRGFRNAVDPASNAPQVTLLEPIENFDSIASGDTPPDELGVTADDTHSIEIRLRYPAPYLVSILEYPVSYPRHKGIRTTENQLPISNGPYRLTNSVVGTSLSLERNEHYWNPNTAEIERIRYVASSDESAVLNRFRSGEIQLTSTIPDAMLPWIKTNLTVEYRATPQLGVYFIAFDLTEKPFHSAKVRKAVSFVIDRELLVQNVLRGDQVAALSLVPPGIDGYTYPVPEFHNLSYSNRLRLAEKIMREMGYDQSNPLRIKLLYNIGDNHKRIALFVADQIQKNLPVKVSLENIEFRVLLQRQSEPKSWDLIRTSWIADYPDPYNFLSIFRTGHVNNVPKFSNFEFDELLDRSQITNDRNERFRLLGQAETLLQESYPALFLYYYVDRRLVSPKLENFHGNPLAIVRTQHLRWANDST